MMSKLDVPAVNVDTQLESLKGKVSGFSEKDIISWKYFENLQGFDCSNTIDPQRNDNAIIIEESIPFMNILERFSLSDYFPGKLSLQSVLSINDVKFEGARDVSDIPWAILYEIIAVNFNFRENVLNNFIRDMSENQEDSDDDDFLSDTSSDIDTTDADSLNFHPLDVFMAIFQCCDPFLKRVLAQKISICQLAVPFVFEDYSSGDLVLSLWPLRDIYIDSKSESVATQVLKTVSFLRIGDRLSKSKSKLINEFLRDINEEHSTFFHRDCPLGMNQRTLTNGMIEACWYVPTQTNKTNPVPKDPNKLQSEEPLTILNLRGDAHFYQKQLKTLLLLSNVVIVLISSDDILKEIYSETLKIIQTSNCSVILLTDLSGSARQRELQKIFKSDTASEGLKIKVVTTFLRKQKRYMNQEELQNRVRKNIFRMVKDINHGIKLDEMMSKIKINSDENSKSQRMKAKAEDIHRKIKNYSKPYNRKQTLLPLQGLNLWQEWSKKQKEQKRPQFHAKYSPEETLLLHMQELRRMQVDACNKSSDIMAQFIQVLVEIMHDNTCINYFLIWMRQFLDDESRIIIPKLQDEFFEAFEQYESTQKKCTETKRQMDVIENKLAHASFGLEHFFREMGQIYEAFLSCKEDQNLTIAVDSQKIINMLPMVATKLLLLGQPLELMDGGAPNVPLKWIKAVFHQVKSILGNVRLLSISVLGIQSSGKSTLLNTMFGLRFPVSAGRCTRGIFAQLLPVDKLKSSHEFDYALVIDTEGLRASELAGEKVTHDNELATLVIGAADVVLINVKGETLADMEDVLQIVIHGLMRIKQVNEKQLHLRQSSMFVHQNVSADNVKKQTTQGNKKIVEHLDRMTKEVASQEQIENVSCFKDVIKFDPTQNVRYVPDLWHGARKMAPASPEYSLTVKNVAKDLLDFAASSRTRSDDSYRPFMTIENTFLYFECLWNGILAEDFVFSFRNCLEVKAYSLLESEYQRFVFSLEMLKLDWITDIVRPKLSNCKGINELELVSQQLVYDFQKKIAAEDDKATEDLNTYIEQSELNHLMIQWKEHKITCLRMKAESLKQEMNEQIRQEKEKTSTAISHKNLQVTMEAEINRRAKNIASSLSAIKLEPTESKMVLQFEELWEQWLPELVPEGAVNKAKNKIIQMERDILSTLNDRFPNQKHLIRDGLEAEPLNKAVCFTRLQNSISVNDLTEEHSKIEKLFGKLKNVLFCNKYQVQKAINQILSAVDVIFDFLPKTDWDYEKTHFSRVLEIVKDGIKRHNETPDREFRLLPSLEVIVVLNVSRYSYNQYKELIRSYEERHCIMSSLLNYKPQVRKLFMDLCHAKSQEILATNALCDDLKTLIKERVERNLSRKIQTVINERYFSQKSSLMKNIMEELAKKDDFSQYMEYVHQPTSYVLTWIEDMTNAAVFSSPSGTESSLYEKWTKNHTADLIVYIKDAVDATAIECKDINELDIIKWKSVFVKQISGLNLLLYRNTFQHVTDYNIKSFEEFREHIKRELDEMEPKLIRGFKPNTPNDLKWPGKTPYECIFDTLWGCKEKCPFCSEPCQRVQPDHASKNDNHTCIQHRSTAVNGKWWADSQQLAHDSCNFKVQSQIVMRCGAWCKCPNADSCQKSHQCKKYKNICPEWDIPACTDTSRSVYWNWFVATHRSQLAKYYNKVMPDIPKTWYNITKDKAIQSLNDVFPKL